MNKNLSTETVLSTETIIGAGSGNIDDEPWFIDDDLGLTIEGVAVR